MVVIETLVICDDCGEQCGADDRGKTAASIRQSRKKYDGWIQVGSKDYCDECAPKHRKVKKPTPTPL